MRKWVWFRQKDGHHQKEEKGRHMYFRLTGDYSDTSIKKLIRDILFVVLVFVIGIHLRNIKTYYLSNLIYQGQENHIDTSDALKSLNIVGASPVEKKIIRYKLGCLPVKYIAKFNNRGFSIKKVDSFDDESLMGYFSIDGKTIYLKDIHCVLHEFCHFIDYTHGFTPFNPEFQKIYDEEVENFDISMMYDGISKEYIKESPLVEYLVECTAMYYFRPNKLKQSCPKTYEYIQNRER